MAGDVYGFIKIEKRRTKRGIYTAAAGIASIICMIVLLAASFFSDGGLGLWAGFTGYISLGAALGGLWSAVRLKKDASAYGKMINASFYISLAAVIFDLAVFAAGCVVLVL